jgi:hypothetical protein
MRQLRIAGGENTAATVDILNEAIAELYPDLESAAGGASSTMSAPRRVTARYILRLEQGFHSSMKVPEWLKAADLDDASMVRASNVPPWLVRAYDLAFGADGYLIDMFTWAHALSADHRHDPPRRSTGVPTEIAPGQELNYVVAGFDAPSEPVRNILRDCAEQLRSHRRHTPPPSRPAPLDSDSSTTYGEHDEHHPEGTLVEPGGSFVAGWVLHNTGDVGWENRYLYQVGDPSTGIIAPRCLAVANTEPGGVVDVRCPVQAPLRPGTYRLCMKMGWQDGTYCYPATILGVILTLIVPPDDAHAWHTPWPTR